MAKRISIKKARHLYQKELHPSKPNLSRKNKHIDKKRRLGNFITALKIRWYRGNRHDLVKKLEDKDGSS